MPDSEFAENAVDKSRTISHAALLWLTSFLMISKTTKTAIAALLVFATCIVLIRDRPGVITVHLAGDSTMAQQKESKRPGTGWGEPLADLLCEGVRLVNHARNGHSTRSFLSEGLWKKLLASVQSDDIVLIQFGHNDQKTGNSRLFTSASKDFKQNLHHFITDAQTKEAHPVLLTSIARRIFNSQGQLQYTLNDYAAATRVVAEELSVPLVDLNAETRRLVQILGPIESKSLYLYVAPDEYPNYAEGLQDDTHLNNYGAAKVARLVALKLETLMPDIFCP